MAFDTRIARSATVSLAAPPGHCDRADPGAVAGVSGSPRPRIAFFFNAQAHQLLHGITTAEALATGWNVRVDILSSTQINLDLARQVVLPENRQLLHFELIGSPLARWIATRQKSVVPPKLLTLWAVRKRLNLYDAIALPERTSILLRWFGVKQPKFIHIDHGAGDRAAGFDKRIALFDFALMAGEKHRRRLLDEGLVRGDNSAMVGYPKFEAADRLRDPDWSPFADRKPVILYNPHFSRELGSWATHGGDVVQRIVDSGRYNLIVAPHVRLCDSPAGRAAAEAIFGPFRSVPGVYLDMGSQRSIDMTYTSMADIYLGDVSSQVYEFLRIPRPCVFINNDGRAWRDDPNYAHWRFGPVIDDSKEIVAALDDAVSGHGAYVVIQAEGFADTFGTTKASSSHRAAAAIAGFMGMVPRGVRAETRRGIGKWSGREDSNLRPLPPEGSALPG